MKECDECGAVREQMSYTCVECERAERAAQLEYLQQRRCHLQAWLEATHLKELRTLDQQIADAELAMARSLYDR